MLRFSNNVWKLAAVASLAWQCLAGTRPYEFEWANRTEDDRPVLLPLVSADGWTCGGADASGSLETATDRALFGDGVVRLTYRATGPEPSLELSPPDPVPLPAGVDTLSLWIWGNVIRSGSDPSTPQVKISARFLDADGKPLSSLLYTMAHKGWFLVQKRLPPKVAASLADGGFFTGFTVTGGTNKDGRSFDFTSFAAYREELRPLAFRPRPKRGVQVFPDAPQGLNTGEGLLPFPTVETTVVPLVAEDPDIEFRLPPDDSVEWNDLAVRYRGGPWIPLALGGGLFPKDAAQGARVRFRRIANSVVADIEAPAGVTEVRFGGMDGTDAADAVPVPYYSYEPHGGMDDHPCVAVVRSGDAVVFHLAVADWTQSNASALFSGGMRLNGTFASNGGARYGVKTDGTRNPVFERFVWSVSPKFEDVLPAIPNPPSPFREMTAPMQWCHMRAKDWEADKAFWRNRRRRGLRHVIVHDWETCMRDEDESFTFRTTPAPGKGGDDGMRGFVRFMEEETEFLYGPYNNYTDFAPVNAWWSADRVARMPDGSLQRAWYRCYAPKPAFINEACEQIVSELQRKFRFKSGYCDVHTCVSPWSRTDYDARVPGAGTFAATYYAFGELLLNERRLFGGPVYSEGGCHFMYCGLDDGNFAQDQSYRTDANPWLVDFDLRRLHPLANNFGMGYPSMFYPKGWKAPDHDSWRDRFLAATVAFGHQGYFMVGNKDDEEHGYFMLQGAGARYCRANAAKIRYAIGNGEMLDTSAAVVSGAFRRSQVAVTYDDGTRTFANGSTDGTMTVRLDGGRILVLPPNGYAAFSGDGAAAAVSGAAWRGGGRLDFAVSPEYVYLNAHGAAAETPFGATDGRMYFLDGGDGTDEVFLREGALFALPYPAQSVVALNEAGQEIGSAEYSVEDGRTRISKNGSAFSYRAVRPDGWQRPPIEAMLDGYCDGVAKSAFLAGTKPGPPKMPEMRTGFRHPGGPSVVTAGFCGNLALPKLAVSGETLRGAAESELDGSSGGTVGVDAVLVVGGVAKSGIFMHPPYRNGVGCVFRRWMLELPADADLSFECFVGKPDYKADMGDGTLYQVVVQPVGEDDLAHTVVASLQTAEHKWTPFSADLSPWRGRKVWFSLVADVGPADDSQSDGSAWGEPIFIHKSPQITTNSSDR